MQSTRLIKKRLEMKVTPRSYTQVLKTKAILFAESAAANSEAEAKVAEEEVVSAAGTNSAAEVEVADLTLEAIEVVYPIISETTSNKAVTKMGIKTAIKVVTKAAITVQAEAAATIMALAEKVEVIRITAAAVVMATGNNNKTLANVNFKMVEIMLTQTKFSESLLYVLTLYDFPPKLNVNTRSMVIVLRRDTSSLPHF